jgi:Outer membrane protein beta-barrel domain
MKRVFLSLMALGCIAASTASAQHVKVSVGAGGVLPSGDYSTLDNAGWHVLGAVEVGIPMSPLGVRVDGMYSQTSHEGGFLSGSTTLSGGAADLVYRIGAPAVPVKFYLLAGVGYYNVDLGLGSESDIGYNGGAGLSFGLGGMNLFAEARYISVQTSGSSALTFVPITAGLAFGL